MHTWEIAQTFHQKFLNYKNPFVGCVYFPVKQEMKTTPAYLERLNLKQKTTKDYERNAATVYECKNLNDAFADAFLSRDRIRVSLRYFFLGIFELALYSIVISWIINRACVLLFVGFVRKMFSKAALRNICNTSIDVIAAIFFFYCNIEWKIALNAVLMTE